MTSLEKEQLLEAVTVKIGILENSKLYKGTSAEDPNGDVKELVDGFRKDEQDGKLSTLELKVYAEDCSFWMNYIMDKEYAALEGVYIDLAKENSRRGKVLTQIKECLNQELLANLSGLDNVDGGKLLTELLGIFKENNM